jgi:GNAT superfamily N-acetyltransferase
MPKLHARPDTEVFLERLIAQTEVTAIRNWRGVQGFLARDGAMIHALYLRPRVRGQGWGARLLDQVKARSDILTLWAFQANDGARAFYRREGFVEVETTDGAGNDEQLPDVRMVWRRET